MSTDLNTSKAYSGLVVLAVVTTAVTGLRFLARFRSRVPVGADDYLILVSLLIMYGLVVASGIIVFLGGAGQPPSSITKVQMETFSQAGFAGTLLYPSTITCTKISILLFYRRIFTTRQFRTATLIVGILCLSWWTCAVTTDFFQCQPIYAAWRPAGSIQPPPTCLNNTGALFWVLAFSLLFTDAVVLCLPLNMIWKLKLSAQQKLVLSGIFLLGSFVFVASIMRIVSTSQELQYNKPYEELVGSTWAVVETQLAIVCACLPILRPLVPQKGWVNRPWTRASSYSTKGPLFARIHSLGRSEAPDTLPTKPPATLPVAGSLYLHDAPSKISANSAKDIGLQTKKKVSSYHLDSINERYNILQKPWPTIPRVEGDGWVF